MRLNDWRWGFAWLAGGLLVMGSAIPLLMTGPLSGRTIVIDPGHGGPRDKGAVGPTGLRESYLNLQVGLRLANSLRQKGAKVILTRSTDAPLVPDDDKDPTADLRARAAVANQAEADLFISVHHNDTTSPTDPRNDTQVYWKLEDPGPSRDFGQILLPKLAGSLKQPRQRLIPGNFAVLRHSRRPAILGEGAYLSNPGSEAYMKRPEAWQREADAYVDAVVTYFNRGVPRLGKADWRDDTLHIDVSTDRHPISDVTLRIDEQPVTPEFDPIRGMIRWKPAQALGNGTHTVRAEIRNSAGNAAYPLESSFTVTRPPANVTARAIPPVWRPDTSVHAFLTATVADPHGQPVADGTEVVFSLGDGHARAQTRSGQASAFLPWPRTGNEPALITAGEAKTSVAFGTIDSLAHVILNVSGWGTDLPSTTALVDRQVKGSADGEGRLALSVTPGSHDLELQAPGYKAWRWAFAGEPGNLLQLNARLDPLYEGTFIGKRIVLDPLTTESAPATDKQTLAVAKWLRDRLVASGAKVTLTRPEGGNPEPADRVRLASRVEADLYVGIAPGTGQAAHYYTSPNGLRLAKLVCASLPGFKPAPEAGYLLSHTPCPALIVRSPLSRPSGVADGLFDAMRRYFAPSAGAG